MTYTFDQLKEDVRKEAEALRVHATKEELGRLDFETLDATIKSKCIYGQMTGNCYCNRAALLIESCAHRYFQPGLMENHGHEMEDLTLQSVLDNANGERVERFLEERVNLFSTNTHYSAIEAYILLPDANNANLIAFLKGETDNLEL